MQFPINLQWWSYVLMHLSQVGQWYERKGSYIILQCLHPLQGINFIIINGVYFSFILESLNVISRSNIPFVLISISPASCFVRINNINDEIDKRDKIMLYIL